MKRTVGNIFFVAHYVVSNVSSVIVFDATFTADTSARNVVLFMPGP